MNGYLGGRIGYKADKIGQIANPTSQFIYGSQETNHFSQVVNPADQIVNPPSQIDISASNSYWSDSQSSDIAVIAADKKDNPSKLIVFLMINQLFLLAK